jgi:hypothetical protein
MRRGKTKTLGLMNKAYARAAVRAYSFALVMGLAAVIPGCNFTYSGHGGPSWLLLPFVFPVVVVSLLSTYRATAAEHRGAMFRFIVISLVGYVVGTLFLSVAGSASIEATFGLAVQWWALWAFFFFPLTIPLVF